MAEITKYRASWNHKTKNGRIDIASSGGSQQIPFSDPAEFTAVLTLLATSDRAAYDATGAIYSDVEDVDDN